MEPNSETWEQRMARERLERDAERETFYEHVGEVVRAMGPAWRFIRPTGDEDSVRLPRALATDGSGACWHVSMESYGCKRGRWAVSGEYPNSPTRGYMGPRAWGVIDYDASAPSITLDGTRDPAALAREILRRFIPAYLTIYAECRKRADAADLAERARVETCKAIARAVGAEWRDSRDTRDVHYDFRVPDYTADADNPPRAEVTIESTGNVSVEVHYLTRDAALRMLAALGAVPDLE